MPPRVKATQPNFRRLQVIEAPPLTVTESVGEQIYLGVMPRDGELGSIRRNALWPPDYDVWVQPSYRMAEDGQWYRCRQQSSLMYTSRRKRWARELSPNKRLRHWLDSLPHPRQRAAQSERGGSYEGYFGGYWVGCGNDFAEAYRTRRLSLQQSGHSHNRGRQRRRRYDFDDNAGIGLSNRYQQQRSRPLEHSLPRDRSVSAPITISNSFVHLIDAALNPAAAEQAESASLALEDGTTSVVEQVEEIAASAPAGEHPNPLALHPVNLEDIPIRTAVTKKQASLHVTDNNRSVTADCSQLAGSTQQGESHIQVDELIQSLETLQLETSTLHNASDCAADEATPKPLPTANIAEVAAGDNPEHIGVPFDIELIRQRIRVVPNSNGPTIPCFEGPPPALNLPTTASPPHRGISTTITRLMDRTKSMRMGKHARSETPAQAEPQRPAKRFRNAFASVANRLSMVANPGPDAATANGEAGRQSRLVRLGSVASRRFSFAASNILSMRGESRGSAVTVAPEPVNVNVKLAVVGDLRVGKTALIQRLLTGVYTNAKQLTDKEISHGYAIEKIELDIDDELKSNLEIWDVSSQCDTSCAFENSIRPLLLAAFDAIVICYDIGRERTLLSAIEKWKPTAKRYCPGVPVVLVGLKEDLRREYPTMWPTLKLDLIPNERTANARGQGEQIASFMDAASYFECSARTGEGVEDFFHSMVRFAQQQQELHRQQQQQNGEQSSGNRVKALIDKMKKRL